MVFLLVWSFAILTAELKPPKNWWGHFTYVVTWPYYLAEYIKENVERG